MASPTEIAALEIRITGVEKAISQFSNFQQTTTKTMSSSEAAVTRSLKNMVSQFVGVAAAARAVQTVISSGVGFNQFVENTTTSFTVMMKSAEKAKAQMKDLYDFAVSSPLTFKETAASSKQLMAYGFAAEELIPTMKTLGSVAIATGHSLDDISYVYGTLKSQGRAYSRDLMQFGMRGIPIYEELAKVMGADVKQIQKMASEGKIGFAEVEKAFENMTTGSGRFSGVIEGYMTTLTGKLSMLGDIAQQSAGSLMKGVTDQLKTFVDSLTKAISGKGFQSFIKDASDVLGGLAGILSTILQLVVALLPIVSKIIKALILPAAVIVGMVLLSKLPLVLFAVGDAAMAVAVKMTALNTSLMATTAAETAITSAATGIGLLSQSLTALAVANPWLLALIGIAAAGGAVITILSGVAAEARASPNENVRMKQLEKDFAQVDVQGPGAGSTKPAWLKASDVQRLAEEYKLAEGTTANILINSGALSRDVWQQYLNTKSVNMALQEQGKIAKGLKHTSKTIEQDQMDFLAGLTGLPASVYEDFFNVDLNAQGNQGAKDYIAGFAEARDQEKDIFGIAYTEDQLKASLEAEAKGLSSALVEGSKVRGLFDTLYDETLRKRLLEVTQQLDGMGKKAKELKYIDLETWWTPLEYAAKRTASQMDDIGVSTDKTLENATKEYKTRMEAYRVDLLITNDMYERVALMKERNKDTIAYKKLLQDITKEGEKQKNIARYSELTGQSGAFVEKMQASAGKAFQNIIDDSEIAKFAKRMAGSMFGGTIGEAVQKEIDSVTFARFIKNMSKGLGGIAGAAMQGTEVGDAASGFMQGGVIGLIASIAAKFISLLSSIENVGKSFNALTTIFEAMKEGVNIEGLMNNAFKPIVQHLTQLGKAIGSILPVIIGLLKVANALFYITNVFVLVALQMIGKAFLWLYDYAIVPFGNAVIGFINAIIGVINTALGWAGVHIEYLDALETSTEAMKDFAKIIDNMKNSLDQTIDYLTDKINDAVDKQLASLQDLYEVGAITATDYEKQAKGLDAQKIKTDDVLVDPKDKAITDPAKMYNRLLELYDLKDVLTNTEGLTEEQQAKLLKDAGLSDINLETAMTNAVHAALDAYGATKTDAAGVIGGSAAGGAPGLAPGDPVLGLIGSTLGGLLGHAFGWWDVGSGNIPHDQFGMVHKGEGIVPATFMDSIRSGELTLSGGGNEGSGQVVNVYVNVEGSVQTENNLAASIARNIRVQRKQGLLTV